MGAGGFAVHASALEAFAQTSDQRHQAFEQCLATARSLQLSPDAFGHIPGIGTHVYQAYDDHVQQCTLGISSAADAMDGISNGVRATILDYQGADAASDERVAAIEWNTSDINIQGPS